MDVPLSSEDGQAPARGAPKRGLLRDLQRSTEQGASQVEAFLNDLSDRYTFECKPEFRFKARKTLDPVTLGANYELSKNTLELVAKPGRQAKTQERQPWWQAVVLNPADGDMRFYSNKVKLGVLQCQVVAGYDFSVKKGGLRWRLTTAWDPGYQKQQVKMPVTDHLTLGVCYDAQQVFPHVEGSVGAGQPAVEWDMGQYHFTFPRVQAALRF